MKALHLLSLVLFSLAAPAHAYFPTTWKCVSAQDKQGYTVKKENRLFEKETWYSIEGHFGEILSAPESQFVAENGSRNYHDDGAFASILGGGTGPRETHDYTLSESIFRGEPTGTLVMSSSTNFGSSSTKYDCSQDE